MKTKEELRIYHHDWCSRNKDKIRETHKRWKAKNPGKAKARNTELAQLRRQKPGVREKEREAAKRWYWNNRDKRRAATAAWRAAHPGSHRLKRYGIGFAEWNAMFTAQNEACAICGTKDSRGRGWQLDHDHGNGRSRGILCHQCNLLLGVSGDSVDTLTSAIQYLQDHRWVLTAQN